MYIIQYLESAIGFTYDRRRKHAYFLGFHNGYIRSYGKKADALRFCTKKEAEDFISAHMNGRTDHRAVKIS